MASIVLIESSCSERYCLARWKNAVHYFSGALQPPPRFDSSSAVSCKKTIADCRPKKNFLAIMLWSTDRSVGSRYLEKFSNGCAKWTFARHDTKCAGPRNSFPPSYSFLPASTFIFPFHTRKNGIRCSRRVSYKTIDAGEENLARPSNKSRPFHALMPFHEREENSIVTRWEKRFRFTLIIRYFEADGSNIF